MPIHSYANGKFIARSAAPFDLQARCRLISSYQQSTDTKDWLVVSLSGPQTRYAYYHTYLNCLGRITLTYLAADVRLRLSRRLHPYHLASLVLTSLDSSRGPHTRRRHAAPFRHQRNLPSRPSGHREGDGAALPACLGPDEISTYG